MAKAATIVRTSRPGVSKARFEALRERSQRAGKRLRELASEDTDVMTSVGTAIGVAMLEQRGTKLPTVGGFDPYLVWGGLGYALTRKSKQKNAAMLRQASMTLLALGANRATTRGSLKIAGVDDDDDDDDDTDD